MTDQLDALPESVQAALRTMEGSAGGNRDDAYDVICAELLRLARVCADLTFAEDCALKRANDRAHKLTARVQELERENEELRSVCEEAELNREGIKIAHKELAAIKKRIAEAPHVTLALANGDDLLILSAERADDWAGKCCALLPLDDEAKG